MMYVLPMSVEQAFFYPNAFRYIQSSRAARDVNGVSIFSSYKKLIRRNSQLFGFDMATNRVIVLSGNRDCRK